MRKTLLLLLAATLVVCCDELHLKNGSVLYGTVEAEEADGLWLAVAGGGRLKVLHEELEQVVIVADGGLREAAELVRVGAWQTAIAHIGALLEESPEQPRLRALLVRAHRGWIERLLALDQPYRAEQALVEAEEQCPHAAERWAALRIPLSARLDALDSLTADALRLQLRERYAEAGERFAALAQAAPLAADAIAEDWAFCEAKLGDAALEEGRWQDAIGHFSKALQLSPILSASLRERLVYAWGLEILELLGEGALGEARVRLDRLRLEFPSSAIRLYFEAVLSRREGRFARSISFYQRLFAGHDPLARSEDFGALEPAAAARVSELLGVPVGGRARRWQETTSRDYELHTSEHFRILHKNQLVIAEVADALESARQRVAETLGLQELPAEIEVVLHADEASYLQAGGCAGYGGVGSIVCRGGRVHARRIDLLQSAPRLLDSAIPHEVAHVLWRNAVHGSDTPLWLREGVATLFEPAASRAHLLDIFARRVCRCEEPTLLQLIGWRTYPREAGEAEDRVAYSHAVVALLAEKGEGADLLMLGRMLVNDLPLQFALQRLYGYPRLADLERAVGLRFGD